MSTIFYHFYMSRNGTFAIENDKTNINIKEMTKKLLTLAMCMLTLSVVTSAVTSPPPFAKHSGKKIMSVHSTVDGKAAIATDFETKQRMAVPRDYRSHDASGALPELRRTLSKEKSRDIKRANIAQVSEVASLNLQGALISRDGWGYGAPYGVYTVPVTTDVEPVLINTLDFDYGNGLIDYGNGTLVAVYYRNFGRGSYKYVYFYDYTTEPWTVSKYNNWPEMTAVSFGCALDPTSGEVYGVFFNSTGSGYVWGKADWDNWQSTAIADTSYSYMSIGCNGEGQYYGISSDGTKLYSIDKTTGVPTLLHELNIPTSGNVQGGCINPTNNTYLQTYSTTSDGAGLIQIDIATGEQILICEYADGLEYSGIYIPSTGTQGNTPVAPQLSVTCPEGAMSVNISLTMPTTLSDGTSMAGESLDYVVKAGEEEVMAGSAMAGQQVNNSIAFQERGSVTFSASVSNINGRSPLVRTTCFIGKGMPASPATATLTWADGIATLSWDAVEDATDEGYLNPVDVTYTVVDEGDNVIAEALTATSYSFSLPETDNAVNYKYGVRANYGGMQSAATYSNSITVGSLVPPLSMDLKTEANFNMHSVIDANNDGSTWRWSDLGAQYPYNSSNSADDWLFTPGISLEGGKTYLFTSFCQAYSNNYLEKIEIKAGRGATVEAMTIPISDITVLNATGQMFEVYITAPETGVYNVGFHALSDPDRFYLFVGDYSLSAPVDVAAPKEVSNATVTPDVNGLRKAVISYTAPMQTVLDTDISGTVTVKVFRDEAEIHSTNATPGQNVSFEDEVAENGTYTYTFTTYKASGEASQSVSVSALLGPRIPDHPRNASLEQVGRDTFVLSWNPVTSDINGVAIDPQYISYKVYTAYIGDGVELGQEIGATTSTSFTYIPEEHISQQQQLFLAVVAYNQDVRSQRIGYASVMTGDPYEMPVLMTDRATLQQYEYNVDGTGSWLINDNTSLEGVTAYDDDNYFAMLQRTEGRESIFIPEWIHISGENPVLSFYFYTISDEDINQTRISVLCDGVETEHAFIINAEHTPEQWHKALVDLSQYAGKDVKIKIKAKVLRYIYNMYDRIQVINNMSHDLEAAIDAPRKVAIGENFNVKVSVTNNGSLTANEYTVHLLRDGEVIESREITTPLLCGEKAVYEFAQIMNVNNPVSSTYVAQVEYAPDQEFANNYTCGVEVKRPLSTLPVVTGLTGNSTNEGNSLQWDALSVPDPTPLEVDEDLETAEAYAHELEGWTFIDNDHSPIGGFQGHVIPGIKSNETLASFIVFTSQYAAGLEGEELFTAHSGNQYLVAFFCYDGTPTDDWAVSPLLTGEAQTISFYAKSFSEETPEMIGVYYTFGDADNTNSYVTAVALNEVPGEWTLYTADIPAGAKHFAIRSCAPDGLMLMIDDIHYSRLDGVYGEHLGYNVYCDGERTNASTHEATTYLHTPEESALNHTYNITSVFTTGESELSDAVVIEAPTSISLIDGRMLTVTTKDHRIIVVGAGESAVSIATIDGRLVYTGRGDTRVEVAPAVYLVAVENRIFKLLVK